MPVQDAPPLDLRKPHHVHHEQNKVSTIDQNEYLYDSLTQLPLDMDSLDDLRDRYAIHEKGSVSKVKTIQEKIQDAINTMRASGAVDADTMSQFERLLRNTLEESKQEQTVETVENKNGKLIRSNKSKTEG